jgi:hypothetical protein
MLIEQYIRDGVKKIDRDKYLRKILKAIASDLKNLADDRFDHDADLLEIIDTIEMVAKDVVLEPVSREEMERASPDPDKNNPS